MRDAVFYTCLVSNNVPTEVTSILRQDGHVNPSTAKVIFIQSTGLKDFRKPSKPCNAGIHWIVLTEVLSDECPCARVSLTFQVFGIILYWPN